MRALCVLHDAVSSIGLIGDALSDRCWHVDEFLVVPADRHDSPNIEVSFPDSSDYNLLVVLGAPWAAYDDAVIGRWLTRELRWLSGAVAAGGAVLGICFGGQALARALGGSVARSAHPEVGWVTIDSDVPALSRAVVPMALRQLHLATRRGRTGPQRRCRCRHTESAAAWACSSIRR